MNSFFQFPYKDNFDFPQRVTSLKAGSSPARVFLEGKRELQLSIFQNQMVRIESPFLENLSIASTTEKPMVLEVSNSGRTYTLRPKREAHRIKMTSSNGGRVRENVKIEIKKEPLQLKVISHDKTVVESAPRFYGQNGRQTLFSFKKDHRSPFWGFGEKTGSFNKKGKTMVMWNVDVMAEHRYHFMRDDYDPSYVSIPFFVTKSNSTYVGYFLDNPTCTFFDLGSETKQEFSLGAYDGRPILYIFWSEKLEEVISRFYFLTGRASMPPISMLGHHQCRWGYKSEKEILSVLRQYKKHKIPLSGLWLDIDYMEGYRLFTWNKQNFPRPKGLIRTLRENGVQTVAIVDPGVKIDSRYLVYISGTRQNIFAKTSSGKNYVGEVWPGKTVFPDFSLPKARKWWSEWVKKFLDAGLSGLWLDMNDPSTGVSDVGDMLFKNGAKPHHFYHNQYANLMAKATLSGFTKRDPSRRNFILTRSASAGIQKYAAVWTGDTVSSFSHLKMSIPQCLNLSLSGVSFNGADVGGFALDVSEELLIRWYQTAFLTPFFRNHSAKGTHPQEPYQFSPKALRIIKKFINLRYKLLPYLYTLFYEYTQKGYPIMRPLIYHFDNPKYYDIGDEFMIGPFILQAPVVTKNTQRKVILPKGWWFDFLENHWVKGPAQLEKKVPVSTSPVYIRDGSILPCYKGRSFHDPASRARENLELLVFSKTGRATGIFYEDDGESTNYKRGVYNEYYFSYAKGRVKVKIIHEGFLKPRMSFPIKIYGIGGRISSLDL